LRKEHAVESQACSSSVSWRVAKSMGGMHPLADGEMRQRDSGGCTGDGGSESLDALPGESGCLVAVSESIGGLDIGEDFEDGLLHRQLGGC